MNNTQLQKYFNFTANAIHGFMAGADSLFNKDKDDILFVAKELVYQCGIKELLCYRGIILKDEKISSLHPHPALTFLSFTEDLKWACHFADPSEKGFGGGALTGFTQSHLGNHGYVIEYIPKLDEILFHYSFLNVLPYKMAMKVEDLLDQKEVMIQQPVKPFTNLKPFSLFTHIPKPKDTPLGAFANN